MDTVARNAREPHRKLGANERIIGAAKLLRECGQDSSVLELTAAAALLYDDPNDATWTKIKAENTFEEILINVCGLKRDEELFGNIISLIGKLQNNKGGIINEISNS